MTSTLSPNNASQNGNSSDATSKAATGIRNRLLQLLPPSELENLLAVSEIVPIRSKKVLFEPDQPVSNVYFPEDGVISLVTKLRDGSGVESMTVGNDGATPLAIFHGLESEHCRGIGQISGTARRINGRDFLELLTHAPETTRVLHRYCQLMFETVSQSAACNRMHVIEQRCARWLLMSQDRVGRDTFDLTQEFLSEMLGVRRAGVTVAMGVLVKQGLISHGRGYVMVTDRAGLERASCECYHTIKHREAKLLNRADGSDANREVEANTQRIRLVTA